MTKSVAAELIGLAGDEAIVDGAAVEDIVAAVVVVDGGSSSGCAVAEACVEVCVQEVVGACARSNRAVV